MENNLITEIFDVEAIRKQISDLENLSGKLMQSIKGQVEEAKRVQKEASSSSGVNDTEKAIDKLSKSTAKLANSNDLLTKSQKELNNLKERAAFLESEEGKALTNLINKEKEELKIKQEQMGQEKLQNELAEKLNNLLNSESNTISALNEENKKLEKLKQQLNIRDEEQLKKITEINEKINTNTALIKKQNTEEQNRTSGVGKYKEAIEAVIKSEGNYKTQLLKLKNTMSELESTIQEHGDETGELAKQYALLQKRAGELTDAQDDMQQRINFLADDYGKFKAVLSGVRAAMGIVSVFSGFTDILGIHSKRLDAVTAKMTALIATMQGLKEVQELLNKDNYFRQLIKTTPAIAKLGGKLGAISKALKGVVATAGIASTAFAAFIAVIAGFGVVTKKVVEKDLKKTKDEIDKIKASTDNATTVMTNFGKSLNMTKFDGLVSQLQNVAKSVKEVIAEFVRMSVMTAITDKLTEAINAQLNATMVRLRNEQKIKKLEEKKRKQEATNTENARLRGEAQAFTGGAEQTSAAQFGDIIPTATEAQEVKEYENAIDGLKTEIKEADKVASGLKSEINELVKNSAEITATTTTIVTDALAGLFPEIEAFRKLSTGIKSENETTTVEDPFEKDKAKILDDYNDQKALVGDSYDLQIKKINALLALYDKYGKDLKVDETEIEKLTKEQLADLTEIKNLKNELSQINDAIVDDNYESRRKKIEDDFDTQILEAETLNAEGKADIDITALKIAKNEKLLILAEKYVSTLKEQGASSEKIREAEKKVLEIRKETADLDTIDYKIEKNEKLLIATENYIKALKEQGASAEKIREEEEKLLKIRQDLADLQSKKGGGSEGSEGSEDKITDAGLLSRKGRSKGKKRSEEEDKISLLQRVNEEYGGVLDAISEANPELGEKLWKNIGKVSDELKKAGVSSQSFMDTLEMAGASANKLFEQGLSTLLDNMSTAREEAFAQQEEAIAENLKLTNEWLDENVTNSEQRERMKEIAQKEADKKTAELQYQQKVREQNQAAVMAIIDGISAGMQALLASIKEFGAKGIAAGMVQLGIAAGTGVAQAGLIKAQKIPRYEKGTDYAVGGLALVGEAGREIIQTRDGATLVEQPSIVNLSPGDKVYPNMETEKILSQQSITNNYNSGSEITVEADTFKITEETSKSLKKRKLINKRLNLKF